MTNECQRYLEDPEAHASHPETCADCRRTTAELEAVDRTLEAGSLQRLPASTMVVDRLPLAAWEGAAHRAWPLVIGTGVLILIIAAAGFAVVGISPASGISDAASGQITGGLNVLSIVRRFGSLVLHAPLAFHVAIGVAFVAVNALLVVLLRRRPRGIDA